MLWMPFCVYLLFLVNTVGEHLNEDYKCVVICSKQLPICWGVFVSNILLFSHLNVSKGLNMVKGS